MIYDLIDDRRPVYVAGRRFLVRRVSLADILRAYAILGSRAHLADAPTAEAGTRILESIGRRDTAEILSWVMEPQDPAWVEAHLEEAPAIVHAIAGMNDLPRIFAEVKPPAPAAAPDGGTGASEEKPGPGSLELMIDLVARRYGVPPHQVCGWPFEEVLTIAALIEREFRQLEETQEGALRDIPAGVRRKVRLGAGTGLADVLNAGGEYRGPTH